MKKSRNKKQPSGKGRTRPRVKEQAEQRSQAWRRPEILAPAGSPETWAAALDAGADAVYLGMKSFSARAFAANFAFEELARVVDMTHEQGAKIFVAFNSLLKESELPDAARALDVLSKINPDALIIQDMGLLRLIKNHFPQFEIHASTLMAGHNLTGFNVMAEMGFDRAVLARELTLNEVERLTRYSPLELELFIHGALCFSFSGLCLMSGFLGGKGSLRGACTQPCRRIYTSGRKKGYFFSPTDLDASTVLARIRELPLSALKIEGRMKGPEYVSNVVRAYRLLMDSAPDDLDEALFEASELIHEGPGRQRSTGFFMSPRAEGALAPTMAATSGIFLGRAGEAGADRVKIELQAKLETGDRIRVQFKRDDERKAFTLKNMTLSGEPVQSAEPGSEIVLEAPFEVKHGDLVFKVDTAKGEREVRESTLLKAFNQRKGRSVKPGEKSARIIKTMNGKPGKAAAKGSGGGKPELWYRIARAEEASGLAQVRPDRIILPLNTPNVRRMAGLRRRLGPTFNKIIWSLPPLLFDSGLTALKRDIAQLARMGVRHFMISNLGHLPLVSGQVKGRRGRALVYADYRLNVLNTWAEQELAELGLEAVSMCLESDEENLKTVLSRPGPVGRLIYLYGRPPLFTSRFAPAGLKDNLPVESPRKERFRIRNERDYMYVLAEQPVFLAPVLKYNLAGVNAFIIDLEFDPRPLASAREITDAVKKGKPLKNASRFNLKRGLY